MRPRLRYVLITLIAVAVLFASGLWWLRHPQQPPLASETAVFFSPHPDDETFGMAQAISHQVRNGRRVVVVLMTDGEGSSLGAHWDSNGGTDRDADGDVDKWDFGLTRRAEFEAAMGALGVTEWRYEGAADSQGAEGWQDGSLSSGDLSDEITQIASEYGSATYFTVMRYEGDQARLLGDAKEHPDHTALCGAVQQLANDRDADAYFYKPYTFYRSLRILRWSPLVSRGDAEDFERKRAAVRAYSEIAKVSTLTLWENSQTDRDEYAVPLSWLE
ncbi:MAG: PIG-L family deacetylase [Coriobacteriia bacterium]